MLVSAVLFSAAYTSSDVHVKNVAFGIEMHRQDVFLESGEELTYCATGSIPIDRLSPVGSPVP